MPMSEWTVKIMDHHEGYINWEEFLHNQAVLRQNRPTGEEMLLSQPAREGKALLQGLLVCGKCGRRLTVRYKGNKGNGGIYAIYECNYRKRDGLADTSCILVRADSLDQAISKRVLEVIKPEQIKIALEALEEVERRNDLIDKQWQMRIERAEYEAQLAQRRYEQVDPANRLVAATLESRWNDALMKVEQTKKELSEYQKKRALTATTAEQKEKVLALAKDLPQLWNSPTTKEKDKKHILRLFIKDITVEKLSEMRLVILHVRWQGGACEDIKVNLPKPTNCRYPEQIVETIKGLVGTLTDAQIAERLNEAGFLTVKGKAFTQSRINWIRYKYSIPSGKLNCLDELTVKQVAEKFGVSLHVVYYWIQQELLEVRRTTSGAPYWIRLDKEKEKELSQKVIQSTKIQKVKERIKKPPKTILQEV